MSQTSKTEFLESLARVGIDVDRETLVLKLTGESPSDAERESILREFVSRGTLTEYQADSIRIGSQDKPLTISDYVLLDRLGGGGMGVVYRARHRTMNRIVAVKLLRPGLLDDQSSVERFQRECRAAALLSHPNIVAAYDAGAAGGRYFLVMEHLDGENLSAAVRRKGPLPLDQALDAVVQAARGLGHMHAQGIVHRDVKPSNLMRLANGEVKVLDVGLARLRPGSRSPDLNTDTVSQLTASGDVFGTVEFMSPEQGFQPRSVDCRSDIYSLGCTLHFLLSGRTVYSADSTLGMMISHRDQPIPSLTAASPEVFESLDLTFRRMLAKSPADRHPDIPALLRELEPCLTEARRITSAETMPVTPVPKTGGGSGASPRNSNRRLLSKAGLTALLICIGVAAFAAKSHSDRSKAPIPVKAVASSVLGKKADSALSPRMFADIPDPDGNSELLRDLAEWVLKSGGSLSVDESGTVVSLNAANTPLAQGAPRIVAINFPRGEVLSSERQKVLAQMPHLRHLNLMGAKFSPEGLKQLGELTQLQSLNLFATESSDADLEFLSRLGRLETLQLGYTRLTNVGLDHVKGLEALTELQLTRTAVTDSGLETLRGLSRLKTLHLDQTPVRGKAFAVLAELPDLEKLVLAGLQLDENSLAALANSPRLRELDLSSTNISDALLESVGRMRGLELLRIEKTSITPAGLARLAPLQKLTSIDLTDTKLDDSAAAHLQTLRALRSVRALRSGLTREGVESLQRHIPDCMVTLE